MADANPKIKLTMPPAPSTRRPKPSNQNPAVNDAMDLVPGVMMRGDDFGPSVTPTKAPEASGAAPAAPPSPRTQVPGAGFNPMKGPGDRYRMMLDTPADNQIAFIAPISWVQREEMARSLVKMDKATALSAMNDFYEERDQSMRDMRARAQALRDGVDTAMVAKMAHKPARQASDFLKGNPFRKSKENQSPETHGILSAMLLTGAGATHMDSIMTWSGDRIDTVDGGRIDYSVDKVSVRKVTAQSVQLLIAEAQARGWSSIKAEGSPEFCAALARGAANAGLALDAKPVGVLGIPLGRRIRVSARAVMSMPAPETSSVKAGDKPKADGRAVGKIEQGADFEAAVGEPIEPAPAGVSQPEVKDFAPKPAPAKVEVEPETPKAPAPAAVKVQAAEAPDESEFDDVPDEGPEDEVNPLLAFRQRHIGKSPEKPKEDEPEDDEISRGPQPS